jgi:DNA-binding SARP family transcriptional activator
MVLAVLLASSNRVVSRDELIERAWNGSPPPAAKTSLFTYLSHLRAELGSDAIEHVDGGYLVRVDPKNLDALEFAQLIDSGSASLSSDPTGAAKSFDRALRLWKGLPFGDLGDEPTLLLERAHLAELRLVAEEKHIDASLMLGRHEKVVGELSTLVEQNPFRERFLSQLMVALYRSGRQADALRVFAEARRRFAEELGVDPSPPLWALEERILSHDSALLYPHDQALSIGARELQPVNASTLAPPQTAATGVLPERPGEYFESESLSPEGTAPMPTKRRRRAVIMIIGALIVGSLVGVAAWGLRDSGSFELIGTWTTTECAQRRGVGTLNCSLGGDESTLNLVVGPGETPPLTLYDSYSSECAAKGLDPILTASGTGAYLQDGIAATLDETWCGGTLTPWASAPKLSLRYDPESDSLWGADPGGGGWGNNWGRAATLSWNPAADWFHSPNQANPSPDQWGNTAVWSYMASTGLTQDPAAYRLLPHYEDDEEHWHDSTWIQLQVGNGIPPSPTIRMHSYGGRKIDFANKATLAWKSPVSGIVIIRGHVAMVPAELCDLGDGIVWSVIRGDVALFESPVPVGGVTSFELTVSVTAGETFYFVHDPGWDSDCDLAFLTLDIETP